MRYVLAIVVAVILTLSLQAETVTKLYVPAGAGGDAGRTATLVYGIETNQLITELQPSHDAGLAAANADSTEVWIFGATATTCDIFSTSTDKLIKTIDLERQIIDAAFSPDGKFCLVVGTVPGSGTNGLFVIDCATRSLAFELPDVTDPTAVVVSHDSKSVFCASSRQGTVTRVEIPSFKKASVEFVGYEPSALTLTADDRFLFVVCRGLADGTRGGSQVTVLDTRKDAPFWVLDLGKGS